jgi:hypothetical protein
VSDKRLQVHLDEEAANALAALVENSGMTESDIVRAALKLAEEVGLDNDSHLLKPLASIDWPWPDWWGPLCEKLEEMRNNEEAVETDTGVKNGIEVVDPYGGFIQLRSERSRSGGPRTITVGMLRYPENATAHGVIVRVLRRLADALPPTAAPARKAGWYGAYRISTLLDACIEDDHEWPPEHLGVYLVSRKPWKGTPTAKCEPLYVGSTTGRAARFCTRVGDLIADMFGFYGSMTGHSSGGQHLWEWCHQHRVKPGDLYIGWYTLDGMCPRCDENRWFAELKPSLNLKNPPSCTDPSHARPVP